MTKIVTDAQGNVKKVTVPDAPANGKPAGQKGGLPKVSASGAVAAGKKPAPPPSNVKAVADDDEDDDEDEDDAPATSATGEKETYAQRLKKLPRHKRMAVKTTSAMKRIERFGKITGAWNDALKETAAAAVAAVEKYVKALEALPEDFVAPDTRAARTPALATGTKVTLTEKALGRYKKALADDGVDLSEPMVVTSYNAGKVGVKSKDGSKLFFSRSDIKAPGDAPF